MEHEVLADVDGIVRELAVAVGEAVSEGQLLAHARATRCSRGPSRRPPRSPSPRASGPTCRRFASATRSVSIPPAGRPSRRRHERGRRTARENLGELVDAGTFVEYGPLLFAAQERRRTREELIARTPADGLVGGVGDVDGRPCVVMSYDYTVLAGTQGMRNHAKKDRLFELAERRRLPVVLFAEGGGGRPGDVDMPIVAGLDCRAFALFASLSGLVPLVGVAARLLLRRQRRPARMLRRGDRDRGLEHRDGRPGDDRGRRPRRPPPLGGRPDRRPVRQRRGRPARRRRT